MGIIKLRNKLSKRQIQKTFANIIVLAQQLNKSDFETPLETSTGVKLYINVEIREQPKDGLKSEPLHS